MKRIPASISLPKYYSTEGESEVVGATRGLTGVGSTNSRLLLPGSARVPASMSHDGHVSAE